MKKAFLLGTSAIIAAGLFAGSAQAGEPIDVKVGGFMNQWFGYSNNDVDNVQKFDQWSNSEIIFKGQSQLDNGLKVGLNVQLEANTTADQIDESYAFVEGSFGRFLIGSENDAAYLMHVAAPNVGLPINDGYVDQYIVNPTGSSLDQTVFGGTYITPAGDDDGQKITYFTPRYSGFQLGVSYLPDVDPTGGDRNSLILDTANYTDGFSVGVNYTNSFSGFDVAASGGYYYAGAPDGTTIDNFKAWSAGLNLGYREFTFGGSYADITDGVISGTNSSEGQAYDIGLSYENGPIGASLTYFHGEAEGDTLVSKDDENDSYVGSVRYNLGEGVAVIGSVGYTDFSGEVAGSTDDNNGWYITSGLALRF